MLTFTKEQLSKVMCKHAHRCHKTTLDHEFRTTPQGLRGHSVTITIHFIRKD